MLNEACGFYRNTSAKEESLSVLKRNIKLIDDLKAQVGKGSPTCCPQPLVNSGLRYAP